jgi:hypothetical protein
MALVAIVEAAGGVTSDWDGHPCYAGGAVVARSNARLDEPPGVLGARTARFAARPS